MFNHVIESYLKKMLKKLYNQNIPVELLYSYAHHCSIGLSNDFVQFAENRKKFLCNLHLEDQTLLKHQRIPIVITTSLSICNDQKK